MAKSTYDFPADAFFEDAARAVLESSFKKMIENEKGTRDGLAKRVSTPEEIEALHDMRVGSRRLRSALSVFGKAFTSKDFEMLDREAARLTDALGAVRDLDVQLDGLRALQSTLPANEAYGVGRLIEHQAKLRDKERRALIVELDRMKENRFAKRFKRLLNRALPQARDEAETEPAVRVQRGSRRKGERA